MILGRALVGAGECVHAVRYPGSTCLLPVLPRYDVETGASSRGIELGELVGMPSREFGAGIKRGEGCVLISEV